MFARATIAIDGICGRSHSDHTSRSMIYVLEALGKEHDKAYEKYAPRPYDGEVVLFRAQHQLPGFSGDRSLGWQKLLGANLTVCDVPGHQQNILVEPHLSHLAKELMHRLKSAQERWTMKPIERMAS